MSGRDGGPAFPIWQENMSLGDTAGPGMSLRDYFAAHADISEWKFPTIEGVAEYVGADVPDEDDFLALIELSVACAAKLKYALADAMLVERERDTGGSDG